MGWSFDPVGTNPTKMGKGGAEHIVNMDPKRISREGGRAFRLMVGESVQVPLLHQHATAHA